MNATFTPHTATERRAMSKVSLFYVVKDGYYLGMNGFGQAKVANGYQYELANELAVKHGAYLEAAN